MSSSDTDADLGLDGVFTEPSRPLTPEPTYATYDRDSDRVAEDPSWTVIRVRLVGSHPLWGHYLWNAARAFASYLDRRPILYSGLDVLELGAGAGLPSLVCAKNGARKVILTDYPDPDLVNNLSHNVREADVESTVSVQGYIWGQPVQPLLNALNNSSSAATNTSTQRFSLIILSDLVFNHSQHDALLNSCENALSLPSQSEGEPEPQLLVFYTHHRPRLADRDMEFFAKARSRGWTCEKVLTERFEPMFPEDPGSQEMRATVHGWKLTRKI